MNPPTSPVMQPIANLAAAAPSERDYEVFTFSERMPLEQRTIKYPDGSRFAIVDVTFAVLFPQEDRRAFERAGAQANNPMVIGTCQALEAIRFVTIAPIKSEVNRETGAPVETVDMANLAEVSCQIGNGSTEGTWRLMHPAARGECVVAYMVMSNAPEGATEDFVKSRRRTTR